LNNRRTIGFLPATICLLALVIALRSALAAPNASVGAAITWNLPGRAPHFVAHYIPWFTSAPQWDGWKRIMANQEHDPERYLADGRRDIGSVLYPLIGPYSSLDQSVIRYQLATMKAVGIQGAIIDWSGSDHDRSQALLMIQEAGKLGLRIAICYEEKANFVWPTFRKPVNREEAIQYAESDLAYIESNYTNLNGYMRCNGRPLLLLWNGPPNGRYTVEEWHRILAGLKEKVVFGSGGGDPGYDGLSDFAFGWFAPDTGAANDFGKHSATLVGTGRRKFLVGSLCPGFDDTPVWGWGNGPRRLDRRGLSCLKDTFDRSLTGKPELIQIVTWNDYNEGTSIEPTRSRGFDDVDALATWIGSLSRKKVDHAGIRTPFFDYVHGATVAQRAELPPGSPNNWAASRGLTVETPDYLNTLRANGRTFARPLLPGADLKSWTKGFRYGAQTSATVEGDALRIDIGKVDDTIWSTYIAQAGIPVKEGQVYDLKFRGHASNERRGLVLLQNMGGESGDWHTLGIEQDFDLSTEWHDYSYRFTASRVTSDGTQFVFQLGQQIGQVWIANLIMTPVSTSKESTKKQ